MAVVSTQDIPPHDLNNERAALGCVLLDPRTLSSLQDSLLPTDFYSPAHRMIYQAMNTLVDEDQSIDPTTLANRLRRNGELESIGGLAYLATLEDYVFTTENVAQYARAILDSSRLRQLLEATDQIRHDALSSPMSVGEILDLSEKRLFDLTQHSESRDFTHVDHIAGETIDEINRRFLNRHELTGIPTGFKLLDTLLTGLHRTDLIILAARPSMGKTALALNIATNVVLKNAPVGFFSLEMSAGQLVQRVLCSMARVSIQKVRNSSLGRADLEKLDEQARRLSSAPLYIDDTSHLNILEVRSKARRLKARVKDLGLIVLDYLQLMAGHGKSESRQQEVAEISRSLKSLARELNVPVIALSQLRREAEDRKGKDKEPKLSDLRESGAIEQDADVVLFVHRDKKAEIEMSTQNQPVGQPVMQPAEVIIGKQRNGPLGTVPLFFLSEFTRFESVSPDVL